MSSSQPHDLTDTWHGRFSFPRLLEPVSFTATLRQEGEWLSGVIEELGQRRAAGVRLTSTISGKVIGEEVSFLKTYDANRQGYDSVSYAGRINDGGREIWGTWTIPGSWSGPFIMIRSRGLPYAARLKQEAEV